MARPRGHQLLRGQSTPKPSKDLQHGGPFLEATLACLDRVLPFPKWMIRRLVWVVFWSFTAAPTCIWETMEESFAKRELPSELMDAAIATSSDGASCQPVASVKAWWQKTFGLPTAVAFYYFLYDYVAEPVLVAFGCCGSSLLTTTAGVGLLLTHFGTAVGMEKFRKRQEQRAALATAAVEEAAQAEAIQAAAAKETPQPVLKHPDTALEGPGSDQHFPSVIVEPRTTVIALQGTPTTKSKKSWFKLGRKKKKNPLGTSTNSVRHNTADTELV